MKLEFLKKPENMIRMGKAFIVLSLACFIYSGVIYAIIDHGNGGNSLKLSNNINKILNEKVYTIIFKDGDEKTYVKVKEGKKLEMKENNSKDFLGWYKDNELYDFNSEVKSSFTLNARYKNDVLYTVSFDTDGGNRISSVKVVQGEKVKKPNTPVKDGYKFLRWNLDGKAYDFSREITKDITLTAIWQEKEKVVVSFDSDGGEKLDKLNSYKGEKVGTLPIPKKDGYIFDGWYENDVKYTENAIINEDITLKAKWILKEEVTITFDSGTGEKLEDKKLFKGDKVGTLPTLEREGYDFLGWYDGNSKYNENIEVANDVTLKAKWKEILVEDKYITITFDTNGGNKIDEKKIKENSKVGVLETPIKEGYKFIGWYLDDKEFDSNKVIDEDITLKAKWEKITEIVDPPVDDPVESDMEKAKSLIKDSYEITEAKDIVIESSICEIKLENKEDIEKITRDTADKTITLTFKITCGNDTDTKNAQGIIKKSPYKFTTEEIKEDEAPVEKTSIKLTISPSASGKIYKVDGTFIGNVQNGVIVLDSAVEDKYLLKLDTSENTTYVVTK